MIKVSLDDLIRLYRPASLGKLVGGLIHNLNGPMQNLGLDIEMARYSLKNKSGLDENTAESIISRLKRMEEEHDKLNTLIRAASSKTEDTIAQVNDSFHINLDEFIRQELDYLHTNLYFKHNVDKNVICTDYKPLASILDRYTLTALGWLLQCLAEELERQRANGLEINILSEDSKLKLAISTKGAPFSRGFIEQLKTELSPESPVKPEDMDIAIFLVLLIFNSNGILLGFNDESSFAINFPRVMH